MSGPARMTGAENAAYFARELEAERLLSAALRADLAKAREEVAEWRSAETFMSEQAALERAAKSAAERARDEAVAEVARLREALDGAQTALGDAHYWFKRAAGGPGADYSMECRMGEAEYAARRALASSTEAPPQEKPPTHDTCTVCGRGGTGAAPGTREGA